MPSVILKQLIRKHQLRWWGWRRRQFWRFKGWRRGRHIYLQQRLDLRTVERLHKQVENQRMFFRKSSPTCLTDDMPGHFKPAADKPEMRRYSDLSAANAGK